MISDGTFPNRLSEVDDLTRPDHWYLTEDDYCCFIGENTVRQGFAYSAVIIQYCSPQCSHNGPTA